MLVNPREVVRDFVNRVIKLVNYYHKHRTVETDVVVEWFRNNADLDKYWHKRNLTKSDIKSIVGNLCTAIITYSENPACPIPEALMDLITDDASLVTWCEVHGLLEPSGDSYILTVYPIE